MKKILIMSLILITNSAFAQNISVKQCTKGTGFNVCELGVGTFNSSSQGTPSKGVTLPGVAPSGGEDPQESIKQLSANQQPSGQYSSSVGNVFIFCSGGRPSRLNPLRPIYDQVCPNKNSQVAAPVLIDKSTGQPAQISVTNPTLPTTIQVTPVNNSTKVQDGVVVNQTNNSSITDPTTGKNVSIDLLSPANPPKIDMQLFK